MVLVLLLMLLVVVLVVLVVVVLVVLVVVFLMKTWRKACKAFRSRGVARRSCRPCRSRPPPAVSTPKGGLRTLLCSPVGPTAVRL